MAAPRPLKAHFNDSYTGQRGTTSYRPPLSQTRSERAQERQIRRYGKSKSDTLRSSGLVGSDRKTN